MRSEPVIAIVGSRQGVSEEFAVECLNGLSRVGWIPHNCSVVSGGATGVDTFAQDWCAYNKIPFVAIKPKSYDRLCLLRRDREIVDLADKLVAFKWLDSKTKGTDYTYSLALKKGIPAKIFYYPNVKGFE